MPVRSEGPPLTDHTRRVLLVVIGKTVESIDSSSFNNNLTIRMKNDLYYDQGYLRLTIVWLFDNQK